MTGTATRTSHDQQPGRSDMNEHQRNEHLRTAYRAADQEWRAAGEAARNPSPEDLDAACQRARGAALEALAGAGLDGEEALALAERAARQQDDESEVPVSCAEHDVSRYPAQVCSITWHLLADGYTVTWAPAPAGCSLTLDRHGPHGEHDAYRGTGPTMQRAWDEVRAQLGHGQPQPAGGITREAPGPARGSDRLYRVCSTTTPGRSSTTPASGAAVRTAGGRPRSGRSARSGTGSREPTAMPGTSAATAGTGHLSSPSPSS